MTGILNFIGYRHFRDDAKIEKLVFSFSNQGLDVNILTTRQSYSAISYSNDDFVVIVSEYGEFICVFFLNSNFCKEGFLIGVWTSYSLESDSLSQSGRVLLSENRGTNEFLPQNIYYQEYDTALGDEIEDVLTIYHINKYFFNASKHSKSFENTQFEEIFEKIFSLAVNFEMSLNQLSQEMSDLKQALVDSNKIVNEDALNLKMQVGEGNLLTVLKALQQKVIDADNQEILNDYILFRSNNRQVEDYYSKGLINFPEYRTEKNRIESAILSLIDKIFKS